MKRIAFTLLCVLQGIFARNLEENLRFKRYVTETVIESHTVTAIVPSTCIKLAPSIPPCRKNIQFENVYNIVKYENDM